MLPILVTFRQLPRTGALEFAARELGHRLELVNHRISACHITVAARLNPQGDIGDYAVKIHLSVPGAQIHADSEQAAGARHMDVQPALRSAYHNAKRQLEGLRSFRLGR